MSKNLKKNTSGIRNKNQQLTAAKGKTSLTTLQTIHVTDLESQVQYEKVDMTNFVVPLVDIPLTNGDFDRVYDLLWALPGYSLKLPAERPRGVVCDILRSKVTFYNKSPETVYMRVQKPMGYRDSQSSLAMWEPVFHNELIKPLKPHQKCSVVIHHGRTSQMVPRVVPVGIASCLDVFTASFKREVYSDSGMSLAAPDAKEDGVQVEVQVEYRTSDSSTGQEKRFQVAVYDDDAVMDVVVAGPPATLRGVDIATSNNSPIKYFNFNLLNKGTKYYWVLSGYTDNKTYDIHLSGLDTTIVYMLPRLNVQGENYQMEHNKNVCITAVVDPDSSGEVFWKAILVWYDEDGQKVEDVPQDKKSFNFNGCTLFAPYLKLKPLLFSLEMELLNRGVVQCRGVGRKPSHYLQAKPILRSHHSHLTKPMVEHILDTLVTIHKIVKVGLAIAGTIGLLAVPLPKRAVRVPTTRTNEEEFEHVGLTVKG